MAENSLAEKQGPITITREQFRQIYAAAAFFSALASTLNDSCSRHTGDAAILPQPVADNFWELIDGIQDEVSEQDRKREKKADGPARNSP